MIALLPFQVVDIHVFAYQYIAKLTKNNDIAFETLFTISIRRKVKSSQ